MTYKFRQTLKKQNKKYKRKLSLNSVGENDGAANPEKIIEFQELLKAFIANSIESEMNEHLEQLQLGRKESQTFGADDQAFRRLRADSNMSDLFLESQKSNNESDTEIVQIEIENQDPNEFR